MLKSTPETGHGWILREDRFDVHNQGKGESLMALGNGYLGLRASHEENYTGQTRNLFIAGTFNRAVPGEVSELPNAADIVEMQITLDGEPFSLCLGTTLAYGRTLDLRTGELLRDVTWQSPGGRRYALGFRRFVSLEDAHTIACRVTVAPLTARAVIKIRTGISCRMTNSGSQHFAEGEKRVYDRRLMQLVQTTTESGIDFFTGCACSLFREPAAGEKPADVTTEFGVERRRIHGTYTAEAERGETLVFEKIVSVFTSRDLEFAGGYDLEAMKHSGLAHLRKAADLGYGELFRKSASLWSDYWKTAGIEIESRNSEDQLSVRFAQYHLRCMAPRGDTRISIGAKGLTGEGYKGHVFWDTEIYLLPYFQFTLPSIARGLLLYRYGTLEAARAKAARFGYKGAMYAWESAWTGEEETPEWAALNVMTGKATRVWSGTKEHHITADIACAVWRYYLATGDFGFMKEAGCEIIFECAWFWYSRLELNESLDRYEIRDVIGPDEYTEHVDNNAYTNYMAHHVISLALRLHELLKDEHPDMFRALSGRLGLESRYTACREVLGKIFLPRPDAQGILPQDDTFLGKDRIDITRYRRSDVKQSILLDYSRSQVIELQVLKQADVVMLFFLLGKSFEPSIIEAGLRYYEPKTIHDSSLSTATHCVVAARLGLREEAYGFFREACEVDLGKNPVSSNDGIHAATMGGIWMSAVFGFGGLGCEDGTLELNPVLPDAWSSLSFRFLWKGEPVAVFVSRDSVRITGAGGKALPFAVRVHGRDYRSEAGPLVINYSEVSAGE